MPSTHHLELPPGTRIDAFEITSTLGSGAFGITYLAMDRALQRPVAIKEYCPAGVVRRAEGGVTLMPVATEKREFYDYGLRRFLDEARALARFRSPHIVRVVRFLERNGTAYLIMEFEDGYPLSEMIRERGAMGEAAMRPLLMALLSGLAEVHAQGFLHRDIKPDNVLVRRGGEPVLLDFGAARMALSEQRSDLTIMLTPGYAPFEQYTSQQPQGPWSDLYALGATFYHAMVGTAPLAAPDRVAAGGGTDPVLEAVDALAPGLSPEFHRALRWMLAVQPGDRPPDVAALRALLDGAVVPPVEAGSVASPTASSAGRWRIPGLALAAAAGVSLALWGALRDPATPAAGRGILRDAIAGGGAGPELVPIPAGEVRVGSPPEEPGRDADESPRTRVRIPAMAMGRYEVQVGEFRSFVERTGYVTTAERDAGQGCRVDRDGWTWSPGASWRDPGYPQGESAPVVCVSWDDARAYVTWLAEVTGEPYGLPSESEWEYAARAGSAGAHPWPSGDGACVHANVSDRTRAKAHDLTVARDNIFMCDDGFVHSAPTGRYAANAFGMHDMLGNVWEWTQDCWADGYAELPADGSAWENDGCGMRSFRGGSWINTPRFVRSASRAADAATVRYYNVGFRVVRRGG